VTTDRLRPERVSPPLQVEGAAPGRDSGRLDDGSPAHRGVTVLSDDSAPRSNRSGRPVRESEDGLRVIVERAIQLDQTPHDRFGLQYGSSGPQTVFFAAG